MCEKTENKIKPGATALQRNHPEQAQQTDRKELKKMAR